MTVQQMLNSLPILQRMMELKLPIKKAHGIYSLAKVINEQREFFINEEKKLVEKFNAEILEGGNIRFKDAESQVGFMTEHNALMRYEVDAAALDLSFEDLGDSEFTPVELMQLEGVINFVD